MATATQINVRISDQLLVNAQKYAKEHGFGNVQELMKESLREKLFPTISKEELNLVKKLADLTKNNDLFGTEGQLFKKLKR